MTMEHEPFPVGTVLRLHLGHGRYDLAWKINPQQWRNINTAPKHVEPATSSMFVDDFESGLWIVIADNEGEILYVPED